ncbi:MAG: FAD-dependent oxidoreductase [Pseudomonadales bacterium]|nr:FAD-dependent oxidoreductase [Candidatus Woesebacteria bacterium]MCB9801619.1 FAD-dependent oxidoreductase [Pseudomonadales bacterium]
MQTSTQHTALAIIGSGPAGWAASVYASRAQLSPVTFEGHKSGGQLMWTTDVENYPGFSSGIAGPDLMIEMRTQAQKFGTHIVSEFVTAVDFSRRPFKLWTQLPPEMILDDLEHASLEKAAQAKAFTQSLEPSYTADAVVIATGATAVMLGIPGETELLGKGVSTCAVCDAAFYKDKRVFVVGGGDSAMEDTLALTKFAKYITVVHRRDAFKASKIMQERVLSNEKVDVLWNSQVTKISGEESVRSITIQTEDKTADHEADGVFIAIGHRPQTSIFHDAVTLDDHGYVITRQSPSKVGVDHAQSALTQAGLVAFPTMTSVEGVFAGGDSVDLRYRQAITAAAQGAMAALDAERWLEGQ